MLMDDPRMLRDDTRVASEPWFRHLSVKKVLSIEWLGQTVASVCWICQCAGLCGPVGRRLVAVVCSFSLVVGKHSSGDGAQGGLRCTPYLGKLRSRR